MQRVADVAVSEVIFAQREDAGEVLLDQLVEVGDARRPRPLTLEVRCAQLEHILEVDADRQPPFATHDVAHAAEVLMEPANTRHGHLSNAHGRTFADNGVARHHHGSRSPKLAGRETVDQAERGAAHKSAIERVAEGLRFASVHGNQRGDEPLQSSCFSGPVGVRDPRLLQSGKGNAGKAFARAAGGGAQLGDRRV